MGFFHENHQAGSDFALLGWVAYLIASVFNASSVSSMLDVICVPNLLNVLIALKDESPSCWALFRCNLASLKVALVHPFTPIKNFLCKTLAHEPTVYYPVLRTDTNLFKIF